MRTRLAAMPGESRAEKSRAIAEAITRHPQFTISQRIALFSPMPSEPDVELLWTYGTHHFCYPRITQNTMEFVDVPTLEALTRADWHAQIRELSSADAHVVPPAEIDFILVPGLAFNPRGQRLGRGGGYYDRYLALLPSTTCKIGVCFASQIVEAMPTDAHDQRVDAVATENGLSP